MRPSDRIKSLMFRQAYRRSVWISRDNIDIGMANRTEPKTLTQWIRYVVGAVIALWLVVWMLRISGINVL